MIKNKNYYIGESSAERTPSVTKNIFYGGDLFLNLFERIDVWSEICSYLLKNKQERAEL